MPVFNASKLETIDSQPIIFPSTNSNNNEVEDNESSTKHSEESTTEATEKETETMVRSKTFEFNTKLYMLYIFIF